MGNSKTVLIHSVSVNVNFLSLIGLYYYYNCIIINLSSVFEMYFVLQ